MNNEHSHLSQQELKHIKSNSAVRRRLAFENHRWFFCLYLSDYMQYEFANFHHKLFDISANENSPMDVIVAFRGSAKSTIFSLSYVIWSIVGKQQKKFVLIVSQTQYQARQIMSNLRRELESNDLLKADIGPFQEISDEWGSNSIVLSNFDARITVASSEQSIRGLRHGSHRPEIVICDDIEDLNGTKNREGRDKTYKWFTSDIVPIGDLSTRIIVIGNLLHEDSLLMRLKKEFAEGKRTGLFHEFPLVDGDGRISWPAKFPNAASLDAFKLRIGDESSWFREYLLRIISDEGRVVHPEWIQRYETLPSIDKQWPRAIIMGVDLAISEKATADYTAIVSAYVFGFGSNIKIYILPNVINKKMIFPKTLEKLKELYFAFPYRPTLCIENVGFQESVIQQLAVERVFAIGKSPKGLDKRSRLNLTTQYIRTGKVLFPVAGAEVLIDQLTNFGVEKHDDLADAFSILMLHVIEGDRPISEASSEPPIDMPNYVDFGGIKHDMNKGFFHLDDVY